MKSLAQASFLILAITMTGFGCKNTASQVNVSFPNNLNILHTWAKATIPSTDVTFAYPKIVDDRFEATPEHNGPGLSVNAKIKDPVKTMHEAANNPGILTEFCTYPTFSIAVDTSTVYTSLREYNAKQFSDEGMTNSIGYDDASQYGLYTTINDHDVFITKHIGDKQLYFGKILTKKGIITVAMNVQSQCTYALDEALNKKVPVTEAISTYQILNYYYFIDILKGVAFAN